MIQVAQVVQGVVAAMTEFNRLITIIAMVVGIIIGRGIAASLIWNMFVPQFFGLPALPALIAIALSVLMTVLIPTSVPTESKKEADYPELYRKMFIVFVSPWLGYLFALAAVSFYY